MGYYIGFCCQFETQKNFMPLAKIIFVNDAIIYYKDQINKNYRCCLKLSCDSNVHFLLMSGAAVVELRSK